MLSELKINNLNASYNGTKVLKSVTMDIKPGSITSLMGPSGCGKTTLLRCINRLMELTPTAKVEGEIILDGVNVLKMDPMLLRRKVGMVFQKPNPFPMSIRENVLYGVKAAKMKVSQDELIETCLTKAGIWDEVKDRLNENAFGLSIGQQQRLCIARSLAMSPEILLMDEPTASLDPSSSARVEASIMAMKEEYTIVIVTHNMQQARRVSDFTVFMFLGEVIEFGDTEKIFGQPQKQATHDFIDGRFG